MIVIGKIKIDLMDPELRSLRARMAAHARWAKDDRKAAAERARAARLAKIAREIDPDGVLPPDELAKRVQSVVSEQNTRAAYAKALKQRQKAAGQSEATDYPASENTSPLTTEQESR